MTPRAPSVKALLDAFPDLTRERVATIRAVIHGSVKPEDVSPATAKWVDACYHRPSVGERKMSALDELIGGSGAEAIWSHDDIAWPVAEYVNTGDTYSATILRVRGGRYLLTTWGDWYERNERRLRLK